MAKKKKFKKEVDNTVENRKIHSKPGWMENALWETLTEKQKAKVVKGENWRI